MGWRAAELIEGCKQKGARIGHERGQKARHTRLDVGRRRGRSSLREEPERRREQICKQMTGISLQPSRCKKDRVHRTIASFGGKVRSIEKLPF